MLSPLEASRDQLIRSALGVLKENAAHNRSALPPFRLPKVAQKIITGLTEHLAVQDESAVRALGRGLAHDGLAMRSLVAVGGALMREVLAQRLEEDIALHAHGFLALLTEAMAAGEIAEFSRQRDEMQLALERSIQGRERELRMIIQELSTPIMPVYDQILALPLIGEIDAERAQKINEKLLHAVAERRARTVIIDITGVPSVDVEVASSLMAAARTVELLGARVALVGISPAVARTLAHLDVTLDGVKTLGNLQAGIRYALELQGLAVQKALPRGRARLAPSRERKL